MEAVSTDELRQLVSRLSVDASLSAEPGLADAERIDRIRLFEQLKAAAAAAQAVTARDFDRSQRAAQAVAGVPSARQGRGVPAQLALARRCSPHAAQRWLGWARILTTELPQTLAVLRSGRTTEWRAMLVARETAWLSREDRAALDVELAPRLEGWGDRQVEAETKRAAYRLDPSGYVDRLGAAVADRRVTLRPAPDLMARLTALVPLEQGVAAYAALCRAADTTIAVADDRGRGQIMADTLVERVTGQSVADQVPVEVELVMSEASLLDPHAPAGDEPALLIAAGVPGQPVPARWARQLACGTARAVTGPRWLRRLFTRPGTGQLVALESTRRTFSAGQQRFLRLRDHGGCRMPWCDSAMRHADHVHAHTDGGLTTTSNGAALSEACNYAKQAPGWTARPSADGSITFRTPTGHRYRSRPTELPRARPRPARPPTLVLVRERIVYHPRPHRRVRPG